MYHAEPVVLLLMLVAGLVVLANRWAVPYPVVLVLGGLVLSFVPFLPIIRLDPNLVLFFFLPPLLYPAALFASWRDFQRNLRAILFLAIGLVLATTTVVAWVAHSFIVGLPWAAAFALGAVVSPPDAIAAEAVLKRLRVPVRIQAILSGESLINDATALVTYQFAVAAMVTGHFSLGTASLRFVFVGVGGVAVGLLVGLMMRWVQRNLEHTPVQITLSLLTPFAAYVLAERLAVSGVLATVAAGVYLGWHSTSYSVSFRLQAQIFWEMVAFLLNGFIFIMLGLQLPGILRNLSNEPLSRLTIYGLIVSGTVVLVRMVWVFVATYLSRALSRRIRGHDPAPPWQQVMLLAWSGMRGVVSLAGAFALPILMANGQPFPGRNYILFLTFCVILTTLVGQGLTLPLLIHKFGIEDDGQIDEEERCARLQANEAAVDFIEQKAIEEKIAEDVMSRVRAEYCDRIAQLNACHEQSANPGGVIATHAYQRLQHAALQVERRTIIALRDAREINDEALRRIQRDLDLAEARLIGA
jgi:CPA1 family monovalent cation:H+ antiporter